MKPIPRPSSGFGGSISELLSEPNQPTDTYSTSSVPVIDQKFAIPTDDIPPDMKPDSMLEDVWDGTSFDPAWFNLQPEEFYGNNNNSCGFIPNPPDIVDEVDKENAVQSTEPSATPMSTGIASYTDSNLCAPESQLQTSQIITDEREHEMAYLIRHFTENLGPWMDLFDADKHFGHLVPLKALRDALLRNAIAAVAAKQLGLMKGEKPFTAMQCQRPASMEIMRDVCQVDWFYKAANYYDKAIAFSRIYLQLLSGNLSNAPSPNTALSVPTANSDDLLVAVSIFSLYESLDNVEAGWLQHLTGLRSLLNVVGTKEVSKNEIASAITVGRRASFWNFARADYQAAYINHTPTLLDTEELEMWRSCGLQINNDRSLYLDADKIKNDPGHHRPIVELVSHTLLWVLLRVMNYLAMDLSALELRQTVWDQLIKQLDQWYGALPETFQPCAQIRHPMQSTAHRGTQTQLMEVFFSIDVCAAAVQLYHFARILLLLNKPLRPEESTGNRLKAYRRVANEAIKHAHEICGIALGRPHPAVRVEMLLPLYIAGSCLEADEERKVVVELLRAIEKDTGCATESRVQELIKEWGWSQEPEGVA